MAKLVLAFWIAAIAALLLPHAAFSYSASHIPLHATSSRVLLQLNTYCTPGGAIAVTAPWYCTSYNGQPSIDTATQNAWSSWIPVALMLLTLSMMLGSVIFAFGIAFRNSKLRVFGMGELYEAFATGIFIAAFGVISASIFGFIPGLFVGAVNPYTTSLTYMHATIISAENLLTFLYYANFYAAMYASFQVNVAQGNAAGPLTASQSSLTTKFTYVKTMFPLVFGTGLNVLFIVPSTAISELIIDGLLFLYTEFYMLLFAMYAAIPILLVPGIVLRAFLPTRPIGGVMIAAAIAFYMVMPLLFSIATYFTSIGLLRSLNTQVAALETLTQTNLLGNAATPSAPIVTQLGDVQSSMSSFWMSVLFYPSLIIVLTYYVMINIAELFGGFAHRTSVIGRF